MTSAVGIFAPSLLNVYDLNGNLFEWTLTKWGGDLFQGEDEQLEGQDGSNAIDDSGSRRVLRGGSWLNCTTLRVPSTATTAIRTIVATMSVFGCFAVLLLVRFF